MNGTILCLPVGGLGNKTEALRAYQTIVNKFGPTDLYDDEPDVARPFFEIVAKHHCGKYITDREKVHSYRRPLGMLARHANLSPKMICTTRTCRQSEVKDYERILDRLNLTPKRLELPWKKMHRARAKKYDVLICNGSHNDLVWIRKRYQRWPEVVAALKAKGLTVASVGHPDEYVPGTVDCTGIGLLKTIDLVARCGVFASTDTGLFHVACALGVAVVVIFTATNPTKNCDPSFAWSATVIAPGLGCFPCQGRPESLWVVDAAWNGCESPWPCTGMSPDPIVQEILRRGSWLPAKTP